MTRSSPISDTPAAFALAGIAPVAFALQVAARRMAELAGFAPHLGVVLIAATVAAMVLLGATVAPGRRRRFVAASLCVAAVAALAGAAFHRLPDQGFDAQSYHLPSVLRLIAGWRPLAGPTDLTLSNTYPSATWTVMGGFDTLFGFESGRATGPVLILAAGALLWRLCRRAGAGALSAFAVALVITANPVVVSQMFTGFADGTLYLLAVILIASLILMLEDRGPGLALIGGAALILLVNTKLSGLFFAGLALAVAGGLLLVQDGVWPGLRLWRWRGPIGAVLLALVLAVGFVGFRPYLTNLRDHGALLYPPPDELGYKPGDVGQRPPNMADAGRAGKLVALFFARTDMTGGPVRLKFPATLERSELRMESATRNGGFGPLFGAAAILAVVSLMGAAVARAFRPGLPAAPAGVRAWACLLATGTLTTVLFPEPWWARFVPLAWLIPLSAALLGVALLPVRAPRAAAVVVFALAGANITIAATCAVRDGLANAADIAGKIRRMAAEAGPVGLTRGTLWNDRIDGRHAAEDVWRRRLADQGKTDVVVVAREDCVKAEFLSVDVWRCTVRTPSQ